MADIFSSASDDPPPAEESTLLFGRYRVLHELGRGGMGVVLLAHDEELGHPVAMKLVPELLVRDAEAITDLKKEVLRGMALTHPGIVRTHDFQRDAASAAIVMEFVDGETLSEWKSRQPGGCFNAEQLIPWLEQLCPVLDYAHREARIAHRDLKPRNLMLTREGVIKIADFGIASSLAETTNRISLQANTSGTPAYMSPQQAMGERTSHLDDIYALGATLYELLTGKPPFFRGQILAQVLQATAPPMAERREEFGITGKTPISSAWERTVAACLAKAPAERPQSAGEVCAHLRAFHPANEKPAGSGGESELADSAGTGIPAAPPRHWAVMALATVLALVGGLIALGDFALQKNRRAGTPAIVQATPAPRATPGELVAAATPATTPLPPSTPVPIVRALPALMMPPVAAIPVEPVLAPAPAATPKPASVVEKWLAQTEATYLAMFQREAAQPLERGTAELKQTSLAALDRELANAGRMKPGEALAYRAERQRIELDEGVPTDDSESPPALKAFRAGYRGQSARLETDHRQHVATVFNQYDKVLAANETALTQRQRLDDALLLQRKRDALAKAWLPLAIAPARPPAPISPPAAPWTDALPLMNPEHAQEGRLGWTRTASGIESKPNEGSRAYAGNLQVPINLPRSYVIEAEFTATRADSKIGVTIPVGDGARTTCWIDGNKGFAGLGKVDGCDPYDTKIEAGCGSVFQLHPGHRYTMHAEVRHAHAGIDIQFTVDGKLAGAYRGPTRRLTVSTCWDRDSDAKRAEIGANDPVTFHRVRMRPLDDLKAGETSVAPASPSDAAR